jgi:hypothetical protein
MKTYLVKLMSQRQVTFIVDAIDEEDAKTVVMEGNANVFDNGENSETMNMDTNNMTVEGFTE